MLFELVCAIGLLGSICYWIGVLLALMAFPYRRKPVGDFTPPVTLLKPVRGVEPETYENLKSFIAQDYPAYQVLFGVSSLEDPVIPILERLRDEFPSVPIEIVPVEWEAGANRKVNSLVAMYPRTTHDILILSDADLRVGPNYLRCVAEPFADASIGMVTCPYRVQAAESDGQQLEALAVNVDFIPSVLVAARLGPVKFGLGATMAVRREALLAIGGFEVLAPYLADDNQLGRRVAAKGWKVVLSGYVVDVVLPPMTFRDFWAHQLRWVRTYRVSAPVGYFFSILTHWVPFAIGSGIAVAAGGTGLGLVLAFIAFSCRQFAASMAILRLEALSLSSLKRLPKHLLWLFLLWKDILNVALWALAFLGNEVEWQGRRYRLKNDGTMEGCT